MSENLLNDKYSFSVKSMGKRTAHDSLGQTQ